MSAPKDGGPAFPAAFNGSGAGMTLRDWFAGQALAGLNANTGWDSDMQPKHFYLTVQIAYAQADAMLAERAKKVQS